ncbi:MAG: hypothetical protein H6872_12285 [Methylobacteriaceae bacterium]|nr:hypothetical protein [Methylobacteriaceae bacterium]
MLALRWRSRRAHAAPALDLRLREDPQADAYNRCLANFGPAAPGGGVSREIPVGADRAPAGAAPAARRGGRAKPPWLAARQAEGRRRMMERRKGIVTERRGGRIRATIDLKRK